jgi:hypothetical protein
MARRRTTAVACALALLAAFGLSACESGQKKAREGAEAEGLQFPVDNVTYNVFITRELNPRIVEDKAYYRGPEPPRGQLMYGIFLQACNKTGRPQQSAGDFFVTDNQGHVFRPTPLPKTNDFAYQQRVLPAGRCEPETGSVAQLGPTGGSMLLFKFPLQAAENRPLELHVEPPSGSGPGTRVELDL